MAKYASDPEHPEKEVIAATLMAQYVLFFHNLAKIVKGMEEHAPVKALFEKMKKSGLIAVF